MNWVNVMKLMKWKSMVYALKLPKLMSEGWWAISRNELMKGNEWSDMKLTNVANAWSERS